MSDSKRAGIGAVLVDSSKGPVVKELVRGGGAETCGKVLPGDVIVQVSGKTVKSVAQAKPLILGPAGSEVRITLNRKGTKVAAQVVRGGQAATPTNTAEPEAPADPPAMHAQPPPTASASAPEPKAAAEGAVGSGTVPAMDVEPQPAKEENAIAADASGGGAGPEDSHSCVVEPVQESGAMEGGKEPQAQPLEGDSREAKETARKDTPVAAAKGNGDVDSLGAEAMKVAGNECFAKGEWDKSVQLYSAAIAKNPGNHMYYANRSAAYAKAGKFHAALGDAARCTKMQPTWVKGYFRLGVAQELLGRHAEAVQSLEEGLRLERNHPQIKAALARIKARNPEDVAAGVAARTEGIDANAENSDANAPKATNEEIEKHMDMLQTTFTTRASVVTAASERKIEEEKEWFGIMDKQFAESRERSKQIGQRKVKSSSDITAEKMEQHIEQGAYAEWERSRQEAAKFRAVEQRMDYDGFKNLVSGATLQPMSKGESVYEVPKADVRSFNSMMLEQGSGSSKVGHERQTLAADLHVHSAKDLEKAWRRTKKDDGSKWEIIMGLREEELPQIFGIEVDSEFVEGVVSLSSNRLASDAIHQDEQNQLAMVIGAICQAPRFNLTWKFLGRKEQANFKNLASQVGAKEATAAIAQLS